MFKDFCENIEDDEKKWSSKISTEPMKMLKKCGVWWI
jgi:hypothetical protein